MKKTLSTLVLGLSMTTATQAATLLGLEVGATAWNTHNTLEDKNGAKSKTKADAALGLHAAFEHPVPFLPNIRVEHLSNENDSKALGKSSTTSHTDLTLYYELLDNWVNLDLGLTARAMGAEIDDGTAQYKADSTLGALYARAQFDLPLTGLSLGLVAQHDGGLNGGGESLQDYNAYIQYKLALGFGVTGGYRIQDYTLKYDGFTPAKQDHRIDGAYLSVFWQF